MESLQSKNFVSCRTKLRTHTSRKTVSPLHAHTDSSVASVMSRVDTLPDDFKIAPADDFRFVQGHRQHILELDVSSVDLDINKDRRHGGIEEMGEIYNRSER